MTKVTTHNDVIPDLIGNLIARINNKTTEYDQTISRQSRNRAKGR